MAIFKTGRSRSLTYNGTIAGIVRYWARRHGVGDTTLRLNDVNFEISLNFGMHHPVTIKGSSGEGGDIIENSDGTYTWHPTWTILASNSLSESGVSCTFTDTVTIPSLPLTPPPFYTSATWTLDIGGTWSITFPVEEYVEISVGSDFPSYGGAATPDLPFQTGLRFFEQMIVGGTITVTCSSGGAIATDSGTITSDLAAQEIIYTLGRDMTVTCKADNFDPTNGYASGSPGGSADSVVITAFHQGVEISYPYSFSTDAGSVTESAASVNVPPEGEIANSASVGSYIAALKQFQLSGVVRAMENPYPGTIGMWAQEKAGPPNQQIDVTGGAFSTGTLTQQSVTITSTINETSDSPPNVEEWAPVQCWLRPGAAGDGDSYSLLALGEDTSGWRTLLHGWNFNAISLMQAASIDVDAAPAASNWTAGAHTTFSSDNPLVIVVDNVPPTQTGSLSSTLLSAAPASLQGASWQGVSFAGYRYLRLYLTVALHDGETSKPARLTLGSKYWDLQIKGDGYVDIDLCDPTNVNDATDDKDSKWEYPTVDPATVTDGPYWGVSNVTNFVLENLAVDHTYTLSNIQLRRADHSNITFLPGFKAWVLRNPPVTNDSGVTTTTYVRRFIDGDTDGKRSLEAEDVTWLDISGSESYDTYLPATLADMLNINGSGGAYPSDGWSVTDLKPAPTTGCTGADTDSLGSCYLNSSLPMVYAFGAGAYYDGANWTYGFDHDASSTLTIPAQVLFDSIDWYPGCGDVWGWTDNGYGGPLLLATAAILRGEACGLVLSDRHRPARGATVEVTDSATSADAGSGKTDARGEYKTGSPYGKGQVSYKVQAQSGQTWPFVTETFFARKRQRVCFGVTLTCCQSLFCPDPFYFPFAPQAGDQVRLFLDDWRQIPDVAADEEDQATEEKTPATVGGDR